MLAILQRSLDDGKTAPEAIRAGDAAVDAAKAKIAERQAGWEFPLEVIPWTEDADVYRRNLAALDVILCPIDDAAPFSGGRSDLKILEASACGVLPIVSDSPIHSEWRGIVPMARSSEEFVERRSIQKTISCWRSACTAVEAVAV